MNRKQRNLLLLHYCACGNYQLVKKFYDHDPTFATIHQLTPQQLINQLKITKKKSYELVLNLRKVNVNSLLQEYIRKDIHYLTIFDDDYPKSLKSIYDPPWIIYFQGNKSLLYNHMSLSVVGTRHPSKYIYEELQKILIPVIKKDVSIVSGLALGIDRMAHELTLNNNGKTIAVLGFGLDWVYPAAHSSLFQRMKEKNLIITEYPPYLRPQKWHFPERNRIISGLSSATFVVEAKDKSGSLITADLALQQGRDVFALPGRISNVESQGTNKLIQDGAKIILSENDILEEYFWAQL
ncbi:DNA-processing protein DprA [Evansella sp. AB-P1]|uniref:DNA-processing protein DprA n=1 Tax=Evansella sp. AB-P1 TaxID=3037653 RepID=UPI00241C1631|nr:DNA-processing protein DprA [Evansella sp. AB-P1]MDG5788202.1 DNA-processing protein DprA [Evansella sp. AB-P1]